MEYTTTYNHIQPLLHAHTCDTAEQAETGGTVSLVAVGEALPREGRHRDRHGDGLVELPSSGLHGNNGAERRSVTEDLLHRVIGYGLGLKRNNRTGFGSFWEHIVICLQLRLVSHLQADFDLLGQCPLREGGLNQWDAAAAQSPALWSHLIGLLPDA